MGNLAILTISVDGNWSADDIVNEFTALNYLYKSLDIISRMPLQRSRSDRIRDNIRHLFAISKRRRYWIDRYPSAYRFIAGKSAAFDLASTFTIRRLRYSSPGFQDLFGAGKILEEIRITIAFLLDRKQKLEEHRVDMWQRKAAVEAERLKNIQARLGILKNAGYSPGEIKRMVSEWLLQEDKLAHLVEYNKITSIKITEIEDNIDVGNSSDGDVIW